MDSRGGCPYTNLRYINYLVLAVTKMSAEMRYPFNGSLV